MAAINDLFTKHTFPVSWQESIVTPIWKPKTKNTASELTPDLIHQLNQQDYRTDDQNPPQKVDRHQCGCRAGKSTRHILVRLVTDIGAVLLEFCNARSVPRRQSSPRSCPKTSTHPQTPPFRTARLPDLLPDQLAHQQVLQSAVL